MTQLTYQEALDPYHTIFRLFRLRGVLNDLNELPIDTVRILDYFLLFPFRLTSISFKHEHVHFRRIAKGYNHLRPYGDHPDDWTLFGRMEPIHNVSLSTLLIEGYLIEDLFLKGRVTFSDKEPPGLIGERVRSMNSEYQPISDILVTLASFYPLTGPDGLKRRTQLMEHRYDVA